MGRGWSRRACLMGLLGPAGHWGLLGLSGPANASNERPAPAAADDTDEPRAGRLLQWPRDFGTHTATRIEWWYVTGALYLDGRGPTTGDTGVPDYGFQITFFRSRTSVADRRGDQGERLSPRHLLFAHAALTDVRAARLRHAERITRWGGPAAQPEPAWPHEAYAQARREDTDVRIGAWRLRRQGPAQASVYEGRWSDESAGFGLSLRLQTTQPVLLQGDRGYSRKSPRPGHASAYYSQPQLRAQGTLTVQGREQAVRGTAWLDHEWSSSLLDPDAVGWDWLGMNLDDGSALTVFRLRRADGSVLWTGGSWRPAGGAVRPFEAHEVQMHPGRVWTSAATGARYPVEWAINTPAGRHQVRTLVDAQELDNRSRTGTVYWEGISVLLDEGGRRIGLGYLEMTGYAGRLQI